MADSVNRIIPSPVAPERYPVLRRERDEKNKQESQPKDGGNQGSRAPSASETPPLGEPDDEIESRNDKAKGKILDISA